MSQLQTNVTGYTHGETPLPRPDVFAANAAERKRILTNALADYADVLEATGDRHAAHVLREHAYELQQAPAHNCTCGKQPAANAAGKESALPKAGIDWTRAAARGR